MQPDQWGAFLPIVAIILAFWFLVMRPARKRQLQAKQLQHSIAIDDQVMLTSGIYGRVAGLGDETLELEVAPGVLVTTHRQALSRIVAPAATGPADDEQPAGTDGRPDGTDAPA